MCMRTPIAPQGCALWVQFTVIGVVKKWIGSKDGMKSFVYINSNDYYKKRRRIMVGVFFSPIFVFHPTLFKLYYKKPWPSL